ncbi:putative membrane protein YgcG [Bradyrhizobium elkanii]
MTKLLPGMRRLTFASAALAVGLMLGGPAYAQTPADQKPAQDQAAAPAPGPTASKLPNGQIEQLVAPIALYPDALLSQILMASTYPLEVVEAARWSQDNKTVTGKALEDAMQKQSWDPSVKALAAVPQVLQMMNDKLDWTQQLGDAFLAQEQDVMSAVQTLRQRAEAAGNLKSTPQQKVIKSAPPAGVTAPSGMQQAISIEPVDPDQYYVPVYDPGVVYGAWDYPDYQPFYWSPPGYVAAGVIGFTASVAVGAAIWGGCNWWGRNVYVNVNRYNQFNRTNIRNTNWAHNPAHRGGVAYRDAGVARRFGSGNTPAAREALRNRTGGPGGRVSNAGAGRARTAVSQRAGNRGASVSRRASSRNVTRAHTRAGNRAAISHRSVTRTRVSGRVVGGRPAAIRGGGMRAGVGGFHRGGGGMRAGGGFRGGGFHGGGRRR